MAKAKTQFGAKAVNAVKSLISNATGQRKNSYKLFTVIILDFYIRLASHNERVSLFYGEKANTISDTAKQTILKFVNDNGFDTKVSDDTTIRKCWGKCKEYAKKEQLFSTVDSSIHLDFNASALLSQVESDAFIVDITNNTTPIIVTGSDPAVNWGKDEDRGKPGVKYNAARRNSDGTVYIKTDKKGKQSRHIVNVTNPLDCNNKTDVTNCRVYWEKQKAKAEQALETLAPMIVKKKGKEVFQRVTS